MRECLLMKSTRKQINRNYNLERKGNTKYNDDKSIYYAKLKQT